MTVLPTTQALATAGIDSLERLAVALGLFFAQKTAVLPSTSPFFKAIGFKLRERATTADGEPTVEANIRFTCLFPLQADTRLEAGEILQNVLPFFSLDAPVFPTTSPSLESAPALPEIPPEIDSAEKLMVWALLVLNASLYPSRDWIQISPAYGDNELEISFQFPLDAQALSLNGYQLIAATQRLAENYLALESGAVSQIGMDAFDIAVAEGFIGSRAEWLASLVGPAGPQGEPGADSQVPGPAGEPGEPGPSAYEVAIANGFQGTEAQWLESLVGPAGPQGEPGADSIVPGPPGDPGEPGPSAYEVAIANGFQGTEQQWLESLVGADGDPGPPGQDGTGMAWRGPWNSAIAYAQFDGVGHLGSLWIANTTNTNKIPGTDPEWDLAVAKGDPGQNGSDGQDGSPGSPGEDGTGIIDNVLTLPHTATPSAPTTGNTKVYAKSDNKVYKLDSSGTETELGAGATGPSLSDIWLYGGI